MFLRPLAIIIARFAAVRVLPSLGTELVITMLFAELEWFIENNRQKAMKVVKKLPRDTNAQGMILKGVATGIQGDPQAPDLQTMDKADVALVRELGQIENKYFTEDSQFTKFKGNIREASQKKINDRVKYIKQTLRMD